MANNCYFDSIVQCPCVLRNVQVYCAMYKIQVGLWHLVLSQGENMEHAESDTELLKSEQEQDHETCTNLKKAPPYGRGLIPLKCQRKSVNSNPTDC